MALGSDGGRRVSSLGIVPANTPLAEIIDEGKLAIALLLLCGGGKGDRTLIS
ncbi:MAG: hypothetical protein F6K30_17445 [Cyanothece sp. SIO2G6]|nr:hypothetical protein [Cyanothece sp. SIO2G6]